MNKTCLIISNFQTTTLKGYLNADLNAPCFNFLESDFNQVQTTLINFEKQESADIFFIWALPERLFSEFSKVQVGEDYSIEKLNVEVNQFLELLVQISKRKTIILVNFQAGRFERNSEVLNSLRHINQSVFEKLSPHKNIVTIESSALYSSVHFEDFSPKLWYLSKNPFSTEVYKKVVLEVKSALRKIWGGSKKLLICDCDDTLWGGILGDVGQENIKLGGHDYIGESFSDFQNEILKLKKKGILLAVASKNEESNVLKVFDTHSEMKIKKSDLSAWKINWKDKAQNIKEILSELNLLESSAVFLDDNPVERLRVQECFKEMLVPELPKDKTLYRQFLSSLTCFDLSNLTREDARRTELIHEEKNRESSKSIFISNEEWLKSLQTKVTSRKLDENTITRAHQLLNKTNQMNLRTRRLSADELKSWANINNFYTFQVEDQFGDAGITGLLGFRIDNDMLFIEDFVLSCRVMGRQIEESILAFAYKHAKLNQCKKIEVEYLPTLKNKPCLDFFQNSKFINNKFNFSWDMRDHYYMPDCIQFIEN